jgi:hypothetical protein
MATLGTTNNIIVGAAQIFLGKNTGITVAPAVSGSTPYADTVEGVTADWANVGFTSEGLELSYEPDYLDVEVDQLLDSAALFQTSLKVNLKTSFTEATLENLARAMAYKTSGAGSTEGGIVGSSPNQTLKLGGGSLGAFPLERSLIAVGPSPRVAVGTTERRYYARRVLSVEAVSHKLSRNEVTSFPVNFRLLPDPTYTGQEYGVIVDRKVT